MLGKPKRPQSAHLLSKNFQEAEYESAQGKLRTLHRLGKACLVHIIRNRFSLLKMTEFIMIMKCLGKSKWLELDKEISSLIV